MVDKKLLTPVVYTTLGDTPAHTPADDTTAIAGKYIQVSGDKDNSLSLGSDGGIYGTGGTGLTVSNDADNNITVGSDGGVWSPKPTTSLEVSSDAGNTITTGSDGGIYVPEYKPVASTEAGNKVVIESDGSIYVPETTITKTVGGVVGSYMVAITPGNAVTGSANGKFDAYKFDPQQFVFPAECKNKIVLVTAAVKAHRIGSITGTITEEFGIYAVAPVMKADGTVVEGIGTRTDFSGTVYSYADAFAYNGITGAVQVCSGLLLSEDVTSDAGETIGCTFPEGNLRLDCMKLSESANGVSRVVDVREYSRIDVLLTFETMNSMFRKLSVKGKVW